MADFKLKNYKPFKCDIIEKDSIIIKKVLINFGVVICTASNSLTNYFIPRIQGKQLVRSEEDNFLENNTLTINDKTRGTICLKIILRAFDHTGIQREWNKAFLSSTASFKKHIEKHVPPSMIAKRITNNLDTYNYENAEIGLTKKALVIRDYPANESDTTRAGIIAERDLVLKDANAEVGDENFVWKPENSAYYKLVDADQNGNPIAGQAAYNAKPIDIVFDHNLFSLVNISNIISEVVLEFIDTTDIREVEEKLDKYNFIQKDGNNYIKLIPIAWIDGGQIEQIVNFDYIYSFPHYFSTENLKPF